MYIYIHNSDFIYTKKNNHEMFQEIGEIPLGPVPLVSFRARTGLSAAAPGGDHRPGYQRKAGEYLDVNPS